GDDLSSGAGIAHRNAQDPAAGGAQRVQSTGEGWILNHDHGTGAGVVTGEEAYRLLGAAGDENFLLAGRQSLRRDVSGDGPAKRRVSKRKVAVGPAHAVGGSQVPVPHQVV